MADPCEPLSECKDLDGKLLLQRAVYGPQLAFDPGAVSFGGVASRGSALRTSGVQAFTTSASVSCGVATLAASTRKPICRLRVFACRPQRCAARQ